MDLNSILANADPSRVADALATMSYDEKVEFALLIDQALQAQTMEECRDHFIPFVSRCWPDFISGSHHRIMADAFERVARGELKRLIINMPPRHTKSEFASHFLPAWFIGRWPKKKIIQSTHTADLATGFGRKVKNLIASAEYQSVFPTVSLAADAKASGRWNTNRGGEYYAVGIGGAIAGRGADLFIIDDPHSEQDARNAEVDPGVFDFAYEWYTSGPRQRLQPDAAIVMVMTRWGKRDLTGRVLETSDVRDGTLKWEVINFPAIFPDGRPLWPEFWSLKELEAIRAELPVSKWNAQYQQNPTSEEGAIIKREWWQRWPTSRPPKCDFVIQSWDTAFEAKTRADYSACTTWGVFKKNPTDTNVQYHIILLDAFRARIEFPVLKQEALRMYTYWQPDNLIIEQKASGAPLTQELRRGGIPVQEFTPVRGSRANPNSKPVRVAAISDLVKSGNVWAPDTRWADEVIEEFASFPNGDNDDYVDSGTMALERFRQGGFIQLLSDEPETAIKNYYCNSYRV